MRALPNLPRKLSQLRHFVVGRAFSTSLQILIAWSAAFAQFKRPRRSGVKTFAHQTGPALGEQLVQKVQLRIAGRAAQWRDLRYFADAQVH
jgi:hypothetical protein